jgi:hypothetical protein
MMLSYFSPARLTSSMTVPGHRACFLNAVSLICSALVMSLSKCPALSMPFYTRRAFRHCGHRLDDWSFSVVRHGRYVMTLS